MGRIKNLSSGGVMRAAGVSGKQNKTVRWHNEELTIRQYLPFKDYMQVIQYICDDIKGASDGPNLELVDFATKVNIIQAYAYIDLPTNLEDLYYVVYGSDLYDIIYKTASSKQIDEITYTIRLLILRGANYGS